MLHQDKALSRIVQAAAGAVTRDATAAGQCVPPATADALRSVQASFASLEAVHKGATRQVLYGLLRGLQEATREPEVALFREAAVAGDAEAAAAGADSTFLKRCT